MFLAGKVEYAPRSLKDLIQVSYAIIHRKDPTAAERIKQEELIDQEAKLILYGESVVLATLDFDFNVHHPYQPLIEALMKFDDIHRKEIGRAAWNYITTGLQTSLCLQYEPHVIASAAIYRAAKFLNVNNIPSDGEVWWCEFNITSQLLEEVVNQMMEHYENNPMPLSSDSGALSSHGFTTEPEESDAESSYYQASSAPNVWGSSASSSQPVFSHSSADNLGGPQKSTQIQWKQEAAALMEFLENVDHRRISNEIMEDMERITEEFNKAGFNLELEDWMHGISLSDTFKPEYTDHDENDGGNVESSVGEVQSIVEADSENSVKEEEVFLFDEEKQSQQEEATSSSG